MATREEWVKRPLEERVERLRRTPDELALLIRDQNDAVLSRRPEPRGWAPTEIVCHLRDIEELAMMRFRTMLAMDEPKVLVAGAMPTELAAWGLREGDPLPVDPERWAEERQYLRNDTGAALAAFRYRRDETLELLRRLSPSEWRRGSIHPTLGRMTFEDWTALLAGHDDNHLAQLTRALADRS